MSATSNPEDENNDDRSTDAYIAHLKKNRNIIETWKWQKNPFKKTKCVPRNKCIKIPAAIGNARDTEGAEIALLGLLYSAGGYHSDRVRIDYHSDNLEE
ncbi:hypothetical protein NPIL_188761 [Nephila pilipes]|uniref:Uncharacterized protein n=1 Tax=Nephila pilipes TaxID=299642 RepID=A0A8X6UBF4_NEPPI|nr:hypothetical protein NPIL_188761 [Nephila pilipes]